MTSFLFVRPNGQIIGSGAVPDIDVERLVPPVGSAVVLGFDGEPVEGCYFDFGSSQVVQNTDKPGKYYAFNYDEKVWVLSSELASVDTKMQRNKLLQASDWTDTASAPARLGQELYDQWQTYRQALRDITDQPGYPLDIVWPTPPQ
jgi:hypothetical protein